MKKIGLILLASLISSAAFAGDINGPVYKASPNAAPYYNWTGFYIGGNVGYGVSNNPFDIAAANNNAAFLTGTGVVPTSLKTDARGVLGGAQAGYNQQIGQWVVGLEADIQGSDIHGGDSRLLTGAPFKIPVSLTTMADTKVDWFGTARGRIGYAFDRLLVYGTGGLAYGHVVSTGNVTLGAPAPFSATALGTSDGYKIGYVAGGGIEYALYQNWRIGVEALYVDLGNADSTMGATVGGANFALANRQPLQFGIARAKVNWSF